MGSNSAEKIQNRSNQLPEMDFVEDFAILSLDSVEETPTGQKRKKHLSQIHDLIENLKSVAGDGSKLQNEVEELERRLTKSETLLIRRTSQIKETQARARFLEDNIQQLQAKLESEKAHSQKINLDVEDKQKKLRYYENELKRQTHRSQELQLLQLQLTKSNETLSSRINQLQSTETDLKSQLALRDSDLEKNGKQLRETLEKNEQLSISLKNAINEISDLSIEAEELEEIMNDMNLRVVEQNDELLASLQNQSQLQDEHNDTKKSMKELIVNLREIQKYVGNAALNSFSNLENHFNEAQKSESEKSSRILNQFNAIYSSKVQLEKKVTELKNDLKKAMRELSLISKIQEETQSKLQMEIESKKNLEKDLKAQEIEAQNQSKQFENQFHTIEQEKIQLREKLIHSELQNQNLTEELKEKEKANQLLQILQNENQHLMEELKNREDRIHQFVKKQEENSQLIQQFQRELFDNQLEREDQHRNLKEANELAESLRRELQAQLQKIGEHEEINSKMRMELDEVNSQLQSKVTNLQALEAEMIQMREAFRSQGAESFRRENQLRNYVELVNNRKLEFQKTVAEFSEDLALAHQFNPLRDFLQATEYQLSKIEIQLKRTPTLSESRPALENAVSHLIEQRDFLKSILNASEKQYVNRSLKMSQLLKDGQLDSLPPLPPRRTSK